MQRYTFTQPLDQELPLNLEMLVKYDYVDLPKDKVSQSCATKIAPGKTASIATALQACAAGDYLTILERGKGFPVSVRIVTDGHCLSHARCVHYSTGGDTGPVWKEILLAFTTLPTM